MKPVFTYQGRFFVEVEDHPSSTDTHRIWDQIEKAPDSTWTRNEDSSLKVIGRVVRDCAHIDRTDLQA